MARTAFNDVVLRVDSVTGEAFGLSDVRVHVYLRGTTTYATIYTAATGSTQKVNPFTTSLGKISFFADTGAYDIRLEDSITPARISPDTIAWDSVPGVTGGIPPDLLASGIVESKLILASDAAAGTASRRTLGTGATQAMAGNDSRVVKAMAGSGLRTVRGNVSSTGAILQGAEFNVTKGTLGIYTLTFSPAFTGVPSVLPVSAGGVIASRDSLSTTSARITLHDPGIPGAKDAEFSFSAIGVA